MNILVTGSCGFIGTNLCLSLLTDGHSVTGVDSFTNNYGESIKKANLSDLDEYPNYKHLEADLLSTNLEPIIDGKDIIFHLAGQPSVHNSWGDDFKTYSNRNIVLTQRLLEASRKAKTKRFVNSSSSSIYGRVNSTPTKESDEKRPISPYGVTKLAAENLVSLYASEFNLSTISLRYFTVFGPRQRTDMAFNKLIQAGHDGKSFSLHGDGSQIRDFTYVGDVVEANKLAGLKDVRPGSVFNIGGGSPVSMNEIIAMVEEITNKKTKINYTPLGPGNPMVTIADCTLAADILGWKPKMGIFNGLMAQVAWQQGQA